MGEGRQKHSRVDAALELVHRQRKLVGSTKVGSPAHRQASDVLALIEESHFLLSEMNRLSTPAAAEPSALASPTRREPDPRPAGRLRVPLKFVAVFAAALVAAAVLLEVIDPVSMNIQATELGSLQTRP